MQRLRIQGGVPLEGTITLHGAKNSALPILAAALLCQDTVTLQNCPQLTDVFAACRILTHLGCPCSFEDHTIVLQPSVLQKQTIPEALMQEMRSSIIFLGALLGRSGSCQVSYPGGCELGPRPIDMHLDALTRMGAVIAHTGGKLACTAPDGLHGAVLYLKFPSVGATENILLAAVRANGRTVIHNAAREPEICDLASFLRCCGAHISGDGESTIVVDGVSELHGGTYAIMPDRIAGTTYLAAAAMTGGTLHLKGAVPQQMENILPCLEQMGCRLYPEPSGIYLRAPKRLRALPQIVTLPHPGFPTDAQSLFLTLLSRAHGESILCETVFENRFQMIPYLKKMGADIDTVAKCAYINGVTKLHGETVQATDLRSGAALLLAGAMAEGETIVEQAENILRGYEEPVKNMQNIGICVQ